MKKLLFVIPEFTHGGTNKSLENLLSLLDSDEYNISICCLRKEGVYKNIFDKYGLIRLSSLYYFLFDSFFSRALTKLLSLFHISLNEILFYKESKNEIFNDFNVIIAFQEGIASHFVSKLPGTKVAWVHCDYDLYYKRLVHPFELERKIYATFKKVVCVSDYTAGTFKKRFPEYSNKVLRIYNTLNQEAIRKMSLEKIDDRIGEDEQFAFVSIGRMNPVKQFHLIPSIVDKMNKRIAPNSFKWYIIGPKDLYTDLVVSEINKYNLQHQVILLGGKDNPYPYISKANVLVSTSSYEACPYVVNEAKILHIPVVSSDYPSAKELVNSQCGIISPINNMDEVLCDLISNKNGCYDGLKKSCMETNYTNNDILEVFKSMINSI